MTSRHTRLFKGLVGDSDEHVAREYSNSSSTTAGADGDDDDGGDFKEFWGIVQEVCDDSPFPTTSLFVHSRTLMVVPSTPP